jgi:hypothetical protein
MGLHFWSMLLGLSDHRKPQMGVTFFFFFFFFSPKLAGFDQLNQLTWGLAP